MQEGEIKRAFEILRDQALILVGYIKTFKVLYHDPDTEQLLKETAENFFGGQLNNALLKFIILDIYKIVGPAKTADKINLSTQQITKLVCQNQNMDTCKEILTLNQKLLEFGNKQKDVRDKIIAHFDWDTHLNDDVLGGFEEKELDNFLENLEEYFNKVGSLVGSEGFVGLHTVDPQSIFKPKRDVYGLIKILKLAKEARLAPWDQVEQN